MFVTILQIMLHVVASLSTGIQRSHISLLVKLDVIGGTMSVIFHALWSSVATLSLLDCTSDPHTSWINSTFLHFCTLSCRFFNSSLRLNSLRKLTNTQLTDANT